jgi:hypothetical protein
VTKILGIDPGTAKTGWLLYDDAEHRVLEHDTTDNETLLRMLRQTAKAGLVDVASIERFASYGMAVGQEVFDSVWWTGRFTEALHPIPHVMIFRKRVAGHLCGNARANDANIRTALLDRFGGTAAKGTKARPGPLHGVSGDAWSALALAVTLSEQGWASPTREERT